MLHAIRLRGPWDYQPLSRATLSAGGSLALDDRDLPAGGTLAMPADWGASVGANFRGLVRFTRRFAQPTGLDEISRVWLVLESVDWQAAVSLNGTTLGCVQLANSPTTPCLLVSPSLVLPLSPPLPLSLSSPALPCPARFDIMRILAPRNELTIDVLLPAVDPGTPPLVRPGRENQPGGLIGLVKLEIEASG